MKREANRALLPDELAVLPSVVARHGRELVVEPIDRRVTYRHVKAREVIGIWRIAAPTTRAGSMRSGGRHDRRAEREPPA
jgi:hypothetical protein